MNDFKSKVRFIYVPYLIITIGFIVGYSLFNWLFFINSNSFPLNQDITYFWLLYLLPWIFVLIWLRPRINMLKIKNDKLPFLYILVAGFSICIAAINMQNLVEAVTGKLTKIENINSINRGVPTKYYMINKYYVDKKDMGVTWTDFVNTDSHGSRNTVFRMSIVLPILESVSDTSSNYCSGYIGVMYNNPFWGELKGQELEDKRREYWSNWLSDFENRKVETFVYLDRVEKSYQLEGFTQASRRSKKKCSNYNNIFIAVNAPFENRYNENIKDFLLAFIIGSLAFLGIILIPKLDTKKLYKFQGETSE